MMKDGNKKSDGKNRRKGIPPDGASTHFSLAFTGTFLFFSQHSRLLSSKNFKKLRKKV